MPECNRRPPPFRRLQLCRPLSGAVISLVTAGQAPVVEASIVPPPFGSGYPVGKESLLSFLDASIVPPPFGSGYKATHTLVTGGFVRFNCAAPFRERLSASDRGPGA